MFTEKNREEERKIVYVKYMHTASINKDNND